MWCNTYANLERVLSRRDIAGFDMRVALQMGVDASSSLLDSPAANKLGRHRALFYSEEDIGIMEKFRPYQLPTVEWLRYVGEQLSGR